MSMICGWGEAEASTSSGGEKEKRGVKEGDRDGEGTSLVGGGDAEGGGEMV